MSKYTIVATVERQATDDIVMTVEAPSLAQAEEVAERVLQTFPNPHEQDGVHFCYVARREWSDPRIMRLEKQRPDAPTDKIQDAILEGGEVA